MIDEYELFHGSVIRSLVVAAGRKLCVSVDDHSGRVDSFAINDRIAIHIKHSSKRMSPWQFTFSRDKIEELIALDAKYSKLFILLVCGKDGVVALTPDEFLKISGPADSESYFVRIGRSKNRMYQVNGNEGVLPNKKATGLGIVIEAISTCVPELTPIYGAADRRSYDETN